MTRGQRILTYVTASVGVLVLAWALVLGGLFMMGGVATVSVAEHDEGVRFNLPVPMALVHAAVATAASTEVFSLDDLELEIGGEIGAWAPAVLAVIEVLDDVPNGTTFVSVRDGSETVRVSKERGKFRVEVDTPEVTVKVAIPTRAVKKTVARILD